MLPLRPIFTRLLFVALLAVCSLSAQADHSRLSWHVDYGLEAPTRSTTGSYTVSWRPIKYGSFSLEEKIGKGNYVTVYSSRAEGRREAKTFSGKVNGKYRYRIKRCLFVCVFVTEPVAVRVLSPAPSAIIGPASDSDGDFSLSWGASADAERYELRRRLVGGNWLVIQDSPATSRTETGLGDGSYDYRVRACNATDCSAFTARHRVTVILPPAVPVHLRSSGVGDTDGLYSVSWSSGGGTVTSYSLQEKSSGVWATVQNTLATSKLVGDKAAGVYDYRIQACNSSGCSAFSSVMRVTVSATPLSLHFSEAEDTDGSYTVSWQAGSGEASAYVLQEQRGSGDWVTVQSANALSKTLNDKTNGIYSYRVKACGATACSAFTPAISITVTLPANVPAAPSAFDAIGNLNSLVAQADITATDSVGSVAGSFRVNESGAATYSIPIAAVAGTAGVAP